MAEYFYLDADGQTVHGPVTFPQMWALSEDGVVTMDTMICKGGTEAWCPFQASPDFQLARNLTTPVVSPSSTLPPQPRSGARMFFIVFLAVVCGGLFLLAVSHVLPLSNAVTSSEPSKSLNGEVFIVTKGGQNYKLGLVPVLLYRYDVILPVLSAKIPTAEQVYKEREKIADDLEKQEAEAKNMAEWLLRQYINATPAGRAAADDAYTAQKAKSDDLTKQHEAAVASRDAVYTGAFYLENLPKPLLSTQTNSDGKFSFPIQDSKSYVLIAEGSRSVGEDTEHYYWFVSTHMGESKEKSVMLSNQNLCKSDPVLSLVSTLPP